MSNSRENSDVVREPKPTVRIKEFGDNGIEFQLLVWTESQTHRRGLFTSNINFGIIKKFNANGIQIPFPQRDLHLRTNFDASTPKQED